GLHLGDGWAGVSTVHRLLGLRGLRLPTLEREIPEYHAEWRLPHRVVVCDEASMIDLFMMTALAEALADDAHLVLLGDVDQLPSVRLGAAFRDLCLALPALTCRLSASHRMNPADPGGAEILGVAATVRGGALAAPLPARARAADLSFAGVEHLPRARLPELLARWYEDVLGGPAAFDAVARRRLVLDEAGRLGPDDCAAVTAALERHRAARLLCITRAADHATSAEAVNALFHQRVQRAFASSEPRDGEPDDASVFLPGEPVTILRNDYERELWNGDQGVVIRVASPSTRPLPVSLPAVAFARGSGVVVHMLDEIADNVALAFALTVHKSQGSEYDRVALILPPVDGPLLTREILYTALTRARRSVVVAGDPALFALGVSRRLGRASGLASKLRGASRGQGGHDQGRSR
ncbi:MAG TPA: AAA family ATPase, partial [Polyangia bacterium]